MDPITLNLNEMAHVLGVVPKTLRTWMDDPQDPVPVAQRGRKGASHVFDAAAVVQWYIGRCLAAAAPNAQRLDAAQERARLDRLRCDELETKLAAQRRELIPVTVLRDAAADAAGQICAIFGALPKHIKAACPELRARGLSIIEREVRKAMNAAASIELKLNG